MTRYVRYRKKRAEVVAKVLREKYGSVEGFFQYQETLVRKNNQIYQILRDGQLKIIGDEEKKVSKLEEKIINQLNNQNEEKSNGN